MSKGTNFHWNALGNDAKIHFRQFPGNSESRRIQRSTEYLRVRKIIWIVPAVRDDGMNIVITRSKDIIAEVKLHRAST